MQSLVYDDEPHKTRRKLILEKHPEVSSLYGPDPITKYIVTFVIFVQIFMCSVISQFDWSFVLLFSYLISGCLNNFLSLAIHECAHNLLFRSLFHNKVFSIVANLPLGIPVAIAFKRYHLDHHQFQGIEKKDVDIPTEMERKVFEGKIGKLLFLFCNPLLYALRPLFVNYKEPLLWEWINFMIQMIFNTFIYYNFGWKAIFYNVGGTLLGMGIHPMAGHFISEHYVFDPNQETYSYYGPLNVLSLNVGYHNEHHDFPYIPGSRLPKLCEIASEFYDLKYHTSWIKVLYDFVMCDAISLESRKVRKNTYN